MSSKTLKVSAKKTKSAPRRLTLVITVLLVALTGLIGYGLRDIYGHKSPSAPLISQPELQSTCLKVHSEASSCDAILEIADTDETRIRGLSGRSELAKDQGMLFISDNVETQCFWMRGMLIPLDMIWLDENKVVTKIEPTISPDTYPTQFCSVQPDKYVIELPAGRSNELGVKLGQALTF